MKIVFMGTPEFAVPCLKTLIDSDHEVVGVVTVPDKPAGRGRQMRESAVKQVAVEHNIPVLQPQDLKDEQFYTDLSAIQADLFVIVAFRILPEKIFSMPPLGSFNLHASLLPKFRGAAPINWALIDNAGESGVTTFFLDKGVDTGEMLLQKKVPITIDTTAGELHDSLMQIGAETVLETVNRIADQSITPQKQTGDATKAPKLTKELCVIDWDQPAVHIHNLVRGLSPFPAAFTQFRGKDLKILRTRLTDRTSTAAPGEIVEIGKNGPLLVAASDGVLEILTVKPEGKKAMSVAEYIRGARLETGEVFVNAKAE